VIITASLVESVAHERLNGSSHTKLSEPFLLPRATPGRDVLVCVRQEETETAHAAVVILACAGVAILVSLRISIVAP
jgi:hypothetical protein